MIQLDKREAFPFSKMDPVKRTQEKKYFGA